jgi:hypothetical protein
VLVCCCAAPLRREGLLQKFKTPSWRQLLPWTLLPLLLLPWTLPPLLLLLLLLLQVLNMRDSRPLQEPLNPRSLRAVKECVKGMRVRTHEATVKTAAAAAAAALVGWPGRRRPILKGQQDVMMAAGMDSLACCGGPGW